ncbi:MAG: NAD-binding protein [Alphaproteobacteria bacterium]
MTAKLITNMLCFVHEQALGEGLMLGKKAGLDLPALIEAIQASYGGSFVAGADSLKILEGVYDTTFPIAHACKDMMLTVQLAEASGVPLPLARFVQEAMEKARARYGDDADCLSPIRMAEEDAGIPLRP